MAYRSLCNSKYFFYYLRNIVIVKDNFLDVIYLIPQSGNFSIKQHLYFYFYKFGNFSDHSCIMHSTSYTSQQVRFLALEFEVEASDSFFSARLLEQLFIEENFICARNIFRIFCFAGGQKVRATEFSRLRHLNLKKKVRYSINIYFKNY